MVDHDCGVGCRKPLRLSLFYSAISPELAGDGTVVLVRRVPDGSPQTVTDGVIFGNGFVDWQATAGQYEIRPPGAGR